MRAVYALPEPEGAHGEIRTRAVAAAMQELSTDLKLIEVAELIYLCCAGKHANLDDLIEAAAELFFKKDAIRYAGAAEAEVHWDATPVISFDMELDHPKVKMLFKLRLSAEGATVAIGQILFENFSGGPEAATDLLLWAIADSRLVQAANNNAT